MDNYEKHRRDIIDILAHSLLFAVGVNGDIGDCNSIKCKKCIFYTDNNYISCSDRKIEWLNANYIATSNETIISDSLKILEREINKILPEYLNGEISQVDFENKLYFLFSNTRHWIVGNIPFVKYDTKKNVSEYIDFLDF